MMDLSRISPQEKILLSHVEDNIQIAATQYRPKFTAFLDERQKALVSQYAANIKNLPCMFWGGYEPAQRVVFGVFDEYSQPQGEEFPIDLVFFQFRKQDNLTHRDFLGSMMGQLIKRETIGDIVVEEGRAMVACLKSVTPLLLQMTKVGRYGVKPSLGGQAPIVPIQEYEIIEGTVASNRLDAVVALAVRQSRENCQKLIQQGMVALNYEVCQNNAQQLQENDCLSIRGYGKYRLQAFGAYTRKNRQNLTIYKYK